MAFAHLAAEKGPRIGLSDGIRGEDLLPLSEMTWTRWDVAAVPEGGFGLETGTSERDLMGGFIGIWQ